MANYYHVRPEQIIGPRRQSHIVLARHVAMYVSRMVCGLSLEAIGEEIGGRDHSTVIHGVKSVERKQLADVQFMAQLMELAERLDEKPIHVGC